MPDIRLVTESVLSSFADVVHHNQRRAFRLWLITPWLSFDDSRGDAVQAIHDSLVGSGCTVVLITRPPKEVYHQRAIDLIRRLRTTVYLSPSLHTKLYILECDGFRTAVLGSPNLTARANRQNREIAIEFRTVVDGRDDSTSTIVTELTRYASELRAEDDVQLM